MTSTAPVAPQPSTCANHDERTAHALCMACQKPVWPVALIRDESLAYVAPSGLPGFITLDLRKDEVVDRLELPVPPGTPVPPLDT